MARSFFAFMEVIAHGNKAHEALQTSRLPDADAKRILRSAPAKTHQQSQRGCQSLAPVLQHAAVDGRSPAKSAAGAAVLRGMRTGRAAGQSDGCRPQDRSQRPLGRVYGPGAAAKSLPQLPQPQNGAGFVGNSQKKSTAITRQRLDAWAPARGAGHAQARRGVPCEGPPPAQKKF